MKTSTYRIDLAFDNYDYNRFIAPAFSCAKQKAELDGFNKFVGFSIMPKTLAGKEIEGQYLGTFIYGKED